MLHVVRRPANLLSIVTERHEGGGKRGATRGVRETERHDTAEAHDTTGKRGDKRDERDRGGGKC